MHDYVRIDMEVEVEAANAEEAQQKGLLLVDEDHASVWKENSWESLHSRPAVNEVLAL